MLTKWLAILLVGWVLRHGYFASQLGTPEFTKDCRLLGPWDGRGSSNAMSFPAVQKVYATFAIAFASAVCSSIIYSALVPAPDSAAVAEKEASETPELDGNEAWKLLLLRLDG
eukprot:s952_g4.t1